HWFTDRIFTVISFSVFEDETFNAFISANTTRHYFRGNRRPCSLSDTQTMDLTLITATVIF
ncbi:hypothetical protein L9F63_017644, partial [Diploptera punctata]